MATSSTSYGLPDTLERLNHMLAALGGIRLRPSERLALYELARDPDSCALLTDLVTRVREVERARALSWPPDKA